MKQLFERREGRKGRIGLKKLRYLGKAIELSNSLTCLSFLENLLIQQHARDFRKGRKVKRTKGRKAGLERKRAEMNRMEFCGALASYAPKIPTAKLFQKRRLVAAKSAWPLTTST